MSDRTRIFIDAVDTENGWPINGWVTESKTQVRRFDKPEQAEVFDLTWEQGGVQNSTSVLVTDPDADVCWLWIQDATEISGGPRPPWCLLFGGRRWVPWCSQDPDGFRAVTGEDISDRLTPAGQLLQTYWASGGIPSEA